MTGGTPTEHRNERLTALGGRSARNGTVVASPGHGCAPYPKYKASGVEWLGDVPMHWSHHRLKHLARRPIRNGLGEPALEARPAWPRYIRVTDIAGPRRLRNETIASLPPEIAAKALVDTGDILFAAVGATYGKSYFVVHSSDSDSNRACFAGYLVRFSPALHKVVPSFVAYWTESNAYWSSVRSRFVQATIQNFSAAKYKNLEIVVPPLGEQSCIVGFLDRETAKIDALIGKNEMLVKQLKEQRAALVSRTVTRGLPPDECRKADINPHPKLKPSGVEWLGDVPAHWAVTKLRHIGTFLKGHGGTLNDKTAYGIPCIRYGDIYTTYHHHVRASLGFVSEAASDRYTRIQYGDVLFTGSGETIDDIGKSVAILLHGAICCGGDVIIFRPTHGLLDPVYSGYATDAAHASCQKASMGRGVTVMHIYSRELRYLTIAVPPANEQRAIASFLDRKTLLLDRATDLARREIKLFREYRTRLISDVVTGRVDVGAERTTMTTT